MQEIIEKHKETIRKRFDNEARRAAVLELGGLLESPELKDAADTLLYKIGTGEEDFLKLSILQSREKELWGLLNQALTDQGYAPITTLDEAMRKVGGTTDEQIAAWYPDEVIPYIGVKLGSAPDNSMMARYSTILSLVNREEVIDLVSYFTKSTNGRVLINAAVILGNSKSPKAVGMLMQMTRLTEFSQQGQFAQEMAKALSNFSADPQIKRLLQKLFVEHGNIETRKFAAAGLIKAGELAFVVEVMNTHAEKNWQWSAAKGLAIAVEEMEAPDDELMNALIQAAENHENYLVRLAAFEGFGMFPDDRFLPVLEAGLKTQGYSGRGAIVNSLGSYGEKAISILESTAGDIKMPEWAKKQNKTTVEDKAKAVIGKIQSS